ncbi:4-hydroxythreonine-4-phosphate dehydrogenase PdxA [Pararhodospirillum oryzae]|uniref:4-hydroxythreonine-4-phosphate dehydrogenase n=1 Tax=Pararhodospirillum oryzae TaxID=478448 RepID=A0A512H8A6_9PROT|nr:4-hydroxythreonine-4-phosphate dehydrogenase PdxA [Pararhodospirillum oryzae]GEO81671.1 4-hydroxythreonine-4-phosphate dehydrogenase [Pararhodospirillum oryzae]
MSECEGTPNHGAQEPLLAVSMGEPAGIGGEIALMAWERRAEALPPFFIVGDPDWLASVARRMDLGRVEAIDHPNQAIDTFARALPVLPSPVPLARPSWPGHGDPLNAPAVVGAIEHTVALVAAGAADGVVTLPIHKRILLEGGFTHPGHTEYLGVLAGRHWPDQPARAVMMLVGKGLRVSPVTVHMPLRRAIEILDRDMIVATGEVVARALIDDLGVESPRLVVAGLNPHAGEDGRLGHEDQDIIAPAVATLVSRGIRVQGPLPADTLFHAEARAGYDAALCMVHDQALIPLKTLDFHGGVNVTLGLPFVRTSPDHGTAFALAGHGGARPDSLMAALRVAATMTARRRAQGRSPRP